MSLSYHRGTFTGHLPFPNLTLPKSHPYDSTLTIGEDVSCRSFREGVGCPDFRGGHTPGEVLRHSVVTGIPSPGGYSVRCLVSIAYGTDQVMDDIDRPPT